MLLTRVLLKPKSKNVLVLAESLASGHCVTRIRDRLAEKVEFIYFDPYIQQNVLYREVKKLRSLK